MHEWQALKVRQKEGSESRSSSPRDSGLTMSSAAASDTEGDPRSPVGPSFKNSLAFFQRAAHLVANNAKNTTLVCNWNHDTGARQKETRRRSSRGSSCYGSGGSSSSEVWSVASDDQTTDYFPPHAGGSGQTQEATEAGYEDELGAAEDPGTYEQVLFINGRPQYQDDLSWSGKRSRSNSWTRLSVDGSSSGGGGGAGGGGNPGPDQHYHQPLPSVAHTPTQLPGCSAAPDTTSGVAAAEVHAQTHAEDVTSSFVTPPRRKPYLNFKSVASSISSDGGVEYDHDNLSLIREKVGLSKNSALNTLTRAQSFKEGLNAYTSEYSNTTNGLSRTQSFNDGLASELSELGSGRAKLQRAPSVDEILESVKFLRAKKTMVKSNPDLANVQEPVYSSASLPRHKSSKGKAPRTPGTSSLLGVKYNGHSNSPHYERVPEPDYAQITDSASTAYYENVCKGNNHYENIHLKGEVIYDSPRPTNTQHHYDKVHSDLHYENIKYDAPVYENLDEKEPTYMNVNDKSSNIYSSADTNKRTGSLKSLKSRSGNKVTVSGNSMMQGATYDVPRAATHIYDSPQKQVRSVSQANEYDTPKNNRSVLPQSTQIVLKAKNDQKKKIDDIFADCDQDSLEGERDRQPDIPSPGEC
ncbi:hypothetical protein Pcinc_025042 [Petrolisthes cinctipes]|uniref:Uncharacterized protein n=1 Tax=Petrolisthes cinctipes TaxID=88211 RepID=A0AAE1KDK6_PETCI|nr:hypothetical protein Pcinc_042664 [Petrolisthes cinctipes]KAK3869663.1 hypothetical protein Pcinc_025042 [Petrolisthes cinctipes]